MTHPERIAKCVALVAPSLAKVAATGNWGKAGAPYYFVVDAPNKRKFVITDPETDTRIGVTGTSVEDVITKMEARLKGAN